MRYRSAIVEEHTRLDVAVSGLWGSRFERTLLDIRVFNPHARSKYLQHIPLSIGAMKKKSDDAMKRAREWWSMRRSCLLCCRQVVAWVERRHHSIAESR